MLIHGDGIRCLFALPVSVLLLAWNAGAQPRPLTDVQTPVSAVSSLPQSFVVEDDTLYFLARHPQTGQDVWRWDGTGAPQLVADMESPSHLLAAHGRLYFQDDGVWQSDGSNLGTTWLGPETFRGLYATNDHLFGLRDDGLFVFSDGAWVRRADLPGLRSVHLATLAERLVYTVLREDTLELRSTDGTAAGTILLRSFQADSNAFRQLVAAADGFAYLTAANDDGCFLWRTDGTPDGTRTLTEVGRWSGECTYPIASQIRTAGGLVFFLGMQQDSLTPWRTNGTPRGTFALPAPGVPGDPMPYPWEAATVGDELYFLSPRQDGTTDLWRTDGRRKGTREVYPRLIHAQYLTALGDRLVFQALHSSQTAVWSSDGTRAGTRPVTVKEPTSGPLAPFYLAAFNDRVVFTGGDDVHGRELWWTDGSVARRAFNLAPERASLDEYQRLPVEDPATGTGARVYSTSEDVWLATADGVQPLTSFDEPRRPQGLTWAAGQLFFTRYGGDLWRSDAFAGTSRLVADFPCRTMAMTSFQDQLFFAGVEGTANYLYRTDGLALRTVAEVLPLFYYGENHQPVCPPARTATRSEPSEALMIAADHRLVFSNGKRAGTRTLGGVLNCFAPFCTNTDVVALGDAFYVFQQRGTEGRIWRTRGTEGDAEVFFDSGNLGPPVVWGDHLAFEVFTEEHGAELWTSDGSRAGTRLLADLRPGPASSDPRELTVHAGRLYWSANDGATGRELYRADDPSSAPELVADLFPGPRSSRPSSLTSTGDLLVFAADDGVHGRELWTSDGSRTALVADLENGTMPSSPMDLTAAGDDLFWTAVTDDLGRELWTVDRAFLAERLESTGCPPPAGCLRDGRFTVTVRWRDPRGTGQGEGQPIPFTDESVLFYFFSPKNVELIVKVLDGRRNNGHFWVFYGGLTDLEMWITVSDTTTGEERTYHNPPRSICGGADTAAFPG